MITPYTLAQNTSLTHAICQTSKTPLCDIIKRKRAAAEKACKTFFEAELVLVYGSVALNDILGFFSDIDMLFLGDFKEKRNCQLTIMDEPVIATFHTFESFTRYLTQEARYYLYDDRSSLYYCFVHPLILKGDPSLYQQYVSTEINHFFVQYTPEEFLDQFFWYYGAGLEATLRNDALTGFLKIQKAAKTLLRVHLLTTNTLLRKPLPDNRGFSYLKTIKIPENLLIFLEKAFEREEDVFDAAKKAFHEIAGDYQWYGITL
jgi:hypothetical protein